MAILAGDVKLVASASMGDVPEGGGAPTSRVIIDNRNNEIFKDISDSDRARGRLNAMKVFSTVQTEDVDTYLGVNMTVARPPEDSNVSITLFRTDDVYDTRDKAMSRLEAYLYKGQEWPGYLFENHIAGMRTIQLFQRVGSEIPVIGKTLALVQNEGLANEIEQYVRAIRVSVVERTFTYDGDKDYQAWVVSVELADVLRHDFKGSPPSRMFQPLPTATRTRDSVVADAANYAGVVPLAEPVGLGSFTLKATSIFTNLVPSAQVETPIVASAPYANTMIPVGATELTSYTAGQFWTPSLNMSLAGGCMPGSLSIVTAGATITDRSGKLVVGDQEIGTIDYANGTLVSFANTYNGTKNITYRPAAYVHRVPQSSDFLVTPESRSQSYVGFINPTAAIGTLTISFMVQRTWYVLRDAGDGTLRGYDASHGAGTFNQTTGSFVITLGALPDVGSSIVIQWGVPTQEYSHPVTAIRISQTVQLDMGVGESISPTLLTFGWKDSTGTDKTATTNLKGEVSGHATGQLNLATAEVTFEPLELPPYGTEVTATYDVGAQPSVTLPYPSRVLGGDVIVNPSATNLVPGSVVVQWNTLTDVASLNTYTRDQVLGMGINVYLDPIQTARDNGAGLLMLNGVQVGTVNYTTGDIRFNPDVTISIPSPNYTSQLASGSVADGSDRYRLNYNGIRYVSVPSLYPNDESGWVTIKYYSASGETRRTQTFLFQPSFNLNLGFTAPVIPGSVAISTSTGAVWGDSGIGSLREWTSEGWVTRATIDYTTSKVTMTSWPVSGFVGILGRRSMVTTTGEGISSAFVFRTASAPLRPGSLSIQYATPGGGTAVVTATTAGAIVAPGVMGTVEYETGLVRLAFGDFVVAAGNESEPWFNPAFVGTDGSIFKPAPIATSSLKYAAVSYSYMPLDASLIGIDPVRLPSDGRVPIFRAGTLVVVGNTATTAPMTPTNAQVVNLGRTRLSRAVVRDATGTVTYAGYNVNLEAGTLTFTDVSNMAAPVTIEHRIEDTLVARDVQISGDMTFTRQLTHNYPVEGTYVSSALEYGDRLARVSTVFDQATWVTDEWSDTPTSAGAGAQYNVALSPIEVTNIGASTERFALVFTSTTAFRVVGEHVGQIATGDIHNDCAPINPATGHPYFVVRELGWGSGWNPGNVLRINTVGNLCPVWVIRTIQPGIESGLDYTFDMLTRGDVDRAPSI